MAAAVPGEGGSGDEFAFYFCSFALLKYFKIFGMYSIFNQEKIPPIQISSKMVKCE